MTRDWIPVTEQLPDDGQECWTFIPINEKWYRFEPRVTVHKFHENYSGWGGWWTEIEQHAGNMPLWSKIERHDDDPVLIITHWQPLTRPTAPEVK